MVIRQATIEDIPQIAKLWREMAGMHAEWDPRFEIVEDADIYQQKHLDTILAKDNYYVIVAEIENKIVGYSTVVFSTRPEIFLKRNLASIHDTYVSTDHRKKGIGKQLTDAVINIAKERGVEMINLGVAVDNQVGKAFWKEMGFEPTVNTLTMYLV